MNPLVVAELRKHEPWLRRLAVSLVGDADADDTLQDVWIAAIRHAPSPQAQPERPLRPWLVRVTRNIARSRAKSLRRRRARELRVADGYPTFTPSYESVAAWQEQLRAVTRLVNALDEPFRSTLLLHYADGLELPEIARHLGVPASTVRWRIVRARQKLRRALDERYGSNNWHVAFAPLLLRSRRTRSRSLAPVVAAVTGAVTVVGLLAVGRATFPSSSPRPPERAVVVATPRGASTTVRARSDAFALEAVVAGPDGTAASDARVQVVRRTPGAPTQAPAAVLGRGRLPGAFQGALAPGDYDVVAMRPGLAPAFAIVRGRAGDAVRVELRLSARSLRLTGRVSDRGGMPIAGATVVARDARDARADAAPRFGTQSDEAGRYELDLAPGAYAVEAGHGGYAPASLPLFLVASEARDVVLEPGAQVFGRVVDATDAPVASAECVAVSADRGHAVLQAAVTDAEGRFRFADLPTADVRVLARHRDRSGASSVLRAVAADAVDAGALRVVRGATVAGRVVQAGRPVPSARVSVRDLVSDRALFEPAYTDDAGRFEIPAVWPGVHRVVADAAGLGVASRQVRVELRAGAPETTLELDVPPVPQNVADDAWIDGRVVDAAGAPSRGVKIVAISGGQVRVAQTAFDGSWSVAVPAGLTDVWMPAEGDGTGDVVGGTPLYTSVRVARGERRSGIVLRPSVLRQRVRGIVVDARGEPVEGADVSMENDPLHRRTTSGAGGVFVLDHAAGGALMLRAFHPRFSAAEVTVAATAGSARIVLPARTDLRVNVASGGDPVTIAVLRDAELVDELRAAHDEPLRLTHLPPGDYELRAAQTTPAGCRFGRRVVSLRAGVRADVALDLADGSVVRGAVDSSDAPDATQVELATGGALFRARAGSDGRFLFDCVPSGGSATIAVARADRASRSLVLPVGIVDVGRAEVVGSRRRLGLSVRPADGGLIVEEVATGSPADEARITRFERIELIDDRPAAMYAVAELRALLADAHVLRLGVVDGAGVRRTAEIELGPAR